MRSVGENTPEILLITVQQNTWVILLRAGKQSGILPHLASWNCGDNDGSFIKCWLSFGD